MQGSLKSVAYTFPFTPVYTLSGSPGSVRAGFVRRFHDCTVLDADLCIIVQQPVGNPDQLPINPVRQEFPVQFRTYDSHTEGDTLDLSGSEIAFGQIGYAEVLRSDDLRTFPYSWRG